MKTRHVLVALLSVGTIALASVGVAWAASSQQEAPPEDQSHESRASALDLLEANALRRLQEALLSDDRLVDAAARVLDESGNVRVYHAVPGRLIEVDDDSLLLEMRNGEEVEHGLSDQVVYLRGSETTSVDALEPETDVMVVEVDQVTLAVILEPSDEGGRLSREGPPFGKAKGMPERVREMLRERFEGRWGDEWRGLREEIDERLDEDWEDRRGEMEERVERLRERLEDLRERMDDDDD